LPAYLNPHPSHLFPRQLSTKTTTQCLPARTSKGHPQSHPPHPRPPPDPTTPTPNPPTTPWTPLLHASRFFAVHDARSASRRSYEDAVVMMPARTVWSVSATTCTTAIAAQGWLGTHEEQQDNEGTNSTGQRTQKEILEDDCTAGFDFTPHSRRYTFRISIPPDKTT